MIFKKKKLNKMILGALLFPIFGTLSAGGRDEALNPEDKTKDTVPPVVPEDKDKEKVPPTDNVKTDDKTEPKPEISLVDELKKQLAEIENKNKEYLDLIKSSTDEKIKATLQAEEERKARELKEQKEKELQEIILLKTKQMETYQSEMEIYKSETNAKVENILKQMEVIQFEKEKSDLALQNPLIADKIKAVTNKTELDVLLKLADEDYIKALKMKNDAGKNGFGVISKPTEKKDETNKSKTNSYIDKNFRKYFK